jgi:XTP/dITP diphosphohydrolase|nr:RdgB/HAM1 family non-canonical purine NTP pyrophosphatase [Petrotoga sp. 9PW.55.5.1]
MDEIYLASSNKNKVREINEILENIEINGSINLKYIFDEIEVGDFDVDECGETFVENSIIKALAYGKLINKPVISDDSGLSIVALDGFPGINSARFMKGESYTKKMESILSLLKNKEDRSAFFACAATYYDPEKNILLSCQAEVYGKIAYEVRGNNGFGYDPFFIPSGYNKTFGELPKESKNLISHRAKAIKKLLILLKSAKIL